MEDLVKDAEKQGVGLEQIKVIVNPERHGQAGGQRTMLEWAFTRRNLSGLVSDKTRTLHLSDRVAQMIVIGEDYPLREEEIEHMELCGKKSARDFYPYVGREGRVHLRLKQEDFDQLSPWLPAYEGTSPPQYNSATSELQMDFVHFKELCRSAYWRFTYFRFMPEKGYGPFIEYESTE